MTLSLTPYTKDSEISPMSIELSLITVNYRSRHAFKKCLASLTPQLTKENISFEWLAANNSPEESLADLPARTVYEGENVGFGAAINQAAREARGEFLWLLNPDTEFLRGSISEALGRAREKSPSVFGFSLQDERGNINIHDFGPDLTLACWGVRKFLPNHLFFPGKTPAHVDWTSGASLLIPKKTFETIGGFDKRFFLYFEDRDLCLRARSEAGASCFYDTSIAFRHSSGTSFAGNTKEQKSHYYDSLLAYAEKHLTPGERRFFEMLVRLKRI